MVAAPASKTLDQILAELYPLERPQTEPSTLGKMRAHCRRWAALTGNPTAATVTRPTLLEFRRAALANALAPSTINSHLRTITGLLTLAGHPVAAAGLKLAEREDPLPTPRPDDLARVWKITATAAWPSACKVNARPLWCKCAPALWWRALFVLAFTTGLRRADLFGLKWIHIEADRISTRNKKTKKPQFIPIAEPLRPWLELLRRNGLERVLGPSDRTMQIDRELTRLATLANVPALNPQALRRSSARAYEKAHAGTGRLILNHGKTITDRHYLDVEDTLRDAQAKLAYPAGYLDRPTLERQHLLF